MLCLQPKNLKKITMKKINILVVAMLMVLSTAGVAQTEKQQQEILRNTNVEKLQEISRKAQQKYEANKAEALKMAKEKGWPIIKNTDKGLMELQGVTENGKPLYYITHNADAAESVSTDEVWSGGSAGLDLDGTDMVAGEWDGGDVRLTHQEFNNTGSTRVIDKDGTSSTHYHATHVAGTIIAGGVEAAAKGMAYNATLHAYDWDNDESEMASAAANGLIISNHSYGYAAGWSWDGSSWNWAGDESISNVEDYKFGFYHGYAADIDDLALNAPYYLIVKSAGNDRGDGPGSDPATAEIDGGADGYDCISYKGNAKNILTVGAAQDVSGGYSGDPADVQMTSFSSWGPTDDGRIKPDICGNGYYLYSSYDGSDSDYNSISGTSMSAPNVTGSLLLVQEHYSELHGSVMKAATLKALAIHTADEAGPNDGPDYMFGWGMLNTQTAANVVSNKDIFSYIQEETLANGDTFTLDVTPSGTEPLAVTIVWADLPGTPVAPALDPTDIMLVNDLDMTVTDGSDTFLPWKLNGQNPSAAATTGVNDVDNVEKIIIENPTSDSYTIAIDHKGTLDGGSQDFSIIVTGISNGYAAVTTNEVTDITLNEATVSGEVLSDNGNAVTERGFVYNTTGGPTVDDTQIVVGSGVGQFSTNLTELVSATNYYVRAYAVNSEGIAYGQTIAFSTACDIISILPFTEDFSAGLATCWENIDNDGSGQVWEFNNPDGRTFGSTTADNGFAILDSDYYGSGSSQDADLVTPNMDLTSYISVNVRFEHYFRNYSTSTATFSYSIDGGITWVDVDSWTGSDEGSGASPAVFDMDISEVAGEPNVKFRWNYVGSYAYYWAVDDIEIDGVYGITYPVAFNVSDASAQPIQGATVLAGNTSVETDVDGLATIELPDGTHGYTVSKSGYAEVANTVAVNGAGENVEVGMEITDYVITISITDVDANPVSDASIDINGETLVTDTNGEAEVMLYNGNYSYTVSKNGFDDYSSEIIVDGADLTEFVTLQPLLYTVTLSVESADENQPLANADVAIAGTTLTTGTNGEVSIDLADGEYPYTVSLYGFEDAAGSVTVDGQAVSEPVAMTRLVFSVVFTVTDEDSEEALAGASVAIDGQLLETDIDGQAVVVLPIGDYPYTIQFEGFEDVTGQVTVADQAIDEAVAMAAVRYNVFFEVEDNGEPIIGASITVSGDYEFEETLVTDALGETQTTLRNGEYQIFLQANGYQDYSDVIVVADNDLNVPIVVLSVLDQSLSGKVYPNPTSGALMVDYQSATVVEVVSTLGQTLVKEEVEGATTLDLSSLKEGMYIVRIQTPQGTDVHQIMIER